MKILPIFNNKINNINNSAAQNNFKTGEQTQLIGKPQNLNNIPHYVPFKARESGNYEQAKQYLTDQKSGLPSDNLNIWKFDLDKLEGLQNGIKVFEGVSLKEIAFLANLLTEVAIVRGCNNNCAHCYADAKPIQKETHDHISRMDYEDFTNLTEGFKELNKRLGFNIFNLSRTYYTTLFHDADCSQVYLKDKDGNIHDWEELAREFYEVSEIPQLFDTAGWYLQDKEAQKRVEKYVNSLTLNPQNNAFIDGFNISVNPYHSMYFKTVENMRKGNKAKEEFFREKNAQRVANMLFTLTPLLKLDNYFLACVTRAMANGTKNSYGFSEKDLINTYNQYFLKELKNMYEQDFQTEQKVIKKKEDIKNNIRQFRKIMFDTITTTPSITKKLKDIYLSNNSNVLHTQAMLDMSAKETLDDSAAAIIDANGDVYLTNFYQTFKTDIKLNFKNKDKKTAPIEPNLSNEHITKDLINSYIRKQKKELGDI